MFVLVFRVKFIAEYQSINLFINLTTCVNHRVNRRNSKNQTQVNPRTYVLIFKPSYIRQGP